MPFSTKTRVLLVVGMLVAALSLTADTAALAAKRPKRPPAPSPSPTPTPITSARHAVRFDAGYYYADLSAPQLADSLAAQWQSQGVTDVYFYAYNYYYGARYYTTYPGNVMEDWGRQDLLGRMLASCHARGIRVIAWIFAPEHKQVWDNHPEWREKDYYGRDYVPGWLQYRLCVAHPDFRAWWRGFVQDLLTRYPTLDGIDIAEPQVAEWGDVACYNASDVYAFRQAYPGRPYPGPEWRVYRADTMTDFLLETGNLCHRAGREFHVTQTLTAWGDGSLISNADLRDAIGFDLDGVLGDAARKPDVLVAELIWQQWLAVYGDSRTFTPAWTTWATQQAREQVAGRAQLLTHLELFDFGAGGLDGPLLAQTTQAAFAAGPAGVDVYDTALLDTTPYAWADLSAAWAGK